MIHPSPTWTKGPSSPALIAGEVHLWRVALDHPGAERPCFSVLSPQERERAEKFVFPRDRAHFIVSHGALRMILARYLGAHPAEITFETSPQGKPQLRQSFTDYRFNLSHTDGLALIAIRRGREVGVDVERVDSAIQFEEIADYYFEPTEVWDVRITPAAERALRFFEVWTRKEAQLKASGKGLAALGEKSTGEYAVRNLTPREGYAGAVASEGEDWRLAYWDWNL